VVAVDRSDYWIQRKLHDEEVREAREALDRAVRITKHRARVLKEAEDARFEFVRQQKGTLDSCNTPPTLPPKPDIPNRSMDT
jgi:hypothetical protein